MAAANIAGGLFSMVTGIYLARTLMPGGLGYFSYVFTLIFFFSNFIDLGLSTYGTREIAANKGHFSEYVSAIVSFRLTIAAILCALLIITGILIPGARALKILMAEASLIFFILALSTEWAFQGMEKMYMVLLSFATTGALQLGLVYTFVKGPKDLLRVPILYIIAAIPVGITFLHRLKFVFTNPFIHFRKIFFYLSSSVIIWSISVFAQIYNNFDIFILGLFRPIYEVGYFTVARRIVGGFSILLIFLANAVLPRLSCTFASKDMDGFHLATKKFLKLAAILTIFLFLPAILFSKKIILLTVGPQYVQAAEPLRVMFAGVLMVLFNLPYSTALIAACFEREVLKQAAASAVLSIFLNFALIPKYGMMGAAVSFVAAEALALGLILFMFNKKIRNNKILLTKGEVT